MPSADDASATIATTATPVTADADVGSAYNEFWWDRGVHAARVNGRTPHVADRRSAGRPGPGADRSTAQERAAARRRGAARSIRPTAPRIGRSASAACCSTPARRCCPGPYNNFVQILQTPRSRRHLQRDDPRRARRSAGRPAARRRRRCALLLGDSRGRWEGNTLVVETTNFTDKTNVRGSGRALRLVETLHARRRGHAALRVHGRRSGVVREAVERASCRWRRPTIRSIEYACHEGNYAMTGHPARRATGRNGREAKPRASQ